MVDSFSLEIISNQQGGAKDRTTGCGSYSPASLAYLGDAVFELLVRSKYICEYNAKPGLLHKKAVNVVNASAQAKMVDELARLLDEEETAVYKRGRNASVHSMPKSADLAEYCKATGLEAVFGKLYMDGKTERIAELFDICVKIAEADNDW